MENTLEQKAKFFAQYWGQKAYRNLHWVKEEETVELRSNVLQTLGNVSQGFLLLTPLSAITDEDAIEVARIITGKKLQSDIQYWINDVKNELNRTAPIGIWRIEVFQYLQSKGYALPYMGLSVEQLIEYGWIKLKD